MANDHQLFFEDLEAGHTFELGSVTLSREDIIGFARRYDPQQFHLDEAAAKPVFGGLVASGWQTACLCQRLLVDGFLNQVACLGGAGVENLRLIKPVYVDNKLTGSATVVEKRVSKSKPDRGLVILQCEMANTAGEAVLSMIGPIMVAIR